jgi:hypothetical protein
MEMQNNSRERNKFIPNPNNSSSYYDMRQNNFVKPPMLQNLNQIQQNMGNPYGYGEMQNEGQFLQNNPYQMQFMPGGEASFNKEYTNPNNLISGSSTDRFNKNRNQGIYNYMSTGNQMNPNINSTGYNSQLNGMPDQATMGNARSTLGNDYQANPPTFHPYHHQLQNSSQMNSQNNSGQNTTQNQFLGGQIQKMYESQAKESQQNTEPPSIQITPKVVNGKLINYEQVVHPNYPMPGSREDSRDRINPQRPFVYENYKELEQRNAMWDKSQQQMYDKNTFESLQGSYSNMPPFNRMTEQDSKINSLREQNEVTQRKIEENKDENNSGNYDDVIKQNEMFKSMFEQINSMFKESQQNSEQPKVREDMIENFRKMLKLKSESQENPVQLQKSQSNSHHTSSDDDAESYIQSNLAKNEKLRQKLKQQKHLESDKEAEKELIHNLIASKTPQTPPRSIQPHITNSMRKIRASPVSTSKKPASPSPSPSPNSIIHNSHQSMRKLSEGGDDEEFPPDPNLLALLNRNMEMNDAGLNDAKGYEETEAQRKRREEREKIEKEREMERQKLFDIWDRGEVGDDFWGGSEGEGEHHSVDSMGGEKEKNYLEQFRQEDKEHNNSYKVQQNDELEDLEFVADPLKRKKKINEVIDRVELDLVQDDDDYNSLGSESQQQSIHNTIDEARKFVLKQQLKHELGRE